MRQDNYKIDLSLCRSNIFSYPVLNEINEIDEDGCIEIGIKLLGPELEQVMSAAARKGSCLSKIIYV